VRLSAEATGYVTSLRRCPDGAELNATQKLVLYCLADHHNRSSRRCDPAQALIAAESLVSEATVKRALAYLDSHKVIRRSYPDNQHRGLHCSYSFCALDDYAGLAPKASRAAEGVHHAPLPATHGRGAEGVHPQPRRGSEGVHTRPRNKEEPVIKREPVTARAVNLRADGLVSVEQIENSPEMQAFRDKVFMAEKPRTVQGRKVPVWVES
jgi:Helix-turn-helix domain